MIKKLISLCLTFCLVLASAFVFTACDEKEKGTTTEEVVEVQPTSYQDDREIELRKTNTHIQYRYKGSRFWTNLVALEDLNSKNNNVLTIGEDGFWYINGEKTNIRTKEIETEKDEKDLVVDKLNSFLNDYDSNEIKELSLKVKTTGDLKYFDESISTAYDLFEYSLSEDQIEGFDIYYFAGKIVFYKHYESGDDIVYPYFECSFFNDFNPYVIYQYDEFDSYAKGHVVAEDVAFDLEVIDVYGNFSDYAYYRPDAYFDPSEVTEEWAEMNPWYMKHPYPAWIEEFADFVRNREQYRTIELKDLGLKCLTLKNVSDFTWYMLVNNSGDLDEITGADMLINSIVKTATTISKEDIDSVDELKITLDSLRFLFDFVKNISIDDVRDRILPVIDGQRRVYDISQSFAHEIAYNFGLQDGSQLEDELFILTYKYLNRFKKATPTFTDVQDLVTDIYEAIDENILLHAGEDAYNTFKESCEILVSGDDHALAKAICALKPMADIDAELTPAIKQMLIDNYYDALYNFIVKLESIEPDMTISDVVDLISDEWSALVDCSNLINDLHCNTAGIITADYLDIIGEWLISYANNIVYIEPYIELLEENQEFIYGLVDRLFDENGTYEENAIALLAEYKDVLVLYSANYIGALSGFNETDINSLSELIDEKLTAIINGEFDIVDAIADVKEYLHNISSYDVEDMTNEVDTYIDAASLLIASLLGGEEIDYNELLQDIELPPEIESIDYNRLIEKLKDENTYNILSVDGVNVEYEFDNNGNLVAEYLSFTLTATYDLQISSMSSSFDIRIEIKF